MKSILTLFILLLVCSYAHAAGTVMADPMVISRNAIGLGSIIAVVASWDRNKSILWAILHGLLSWFYVIYFALTRRR